MIKKILYILMLIIITSNIFGQDKKIEVNYVNNPSFEDLKEIPCFWVRSPKDFYRYMIYWKVPTNTTPDIITVLSNPKCWCNPSSRKQSSGKQLAHTGNNMIGIKTYGNGDNGEVACWHEYIHGKLTKPLKKGKEYYIEFWVSHLSISSLFSNNIGVLLSTKLINTHEKVAIYRTPQINQGNVIKNDDSWVKISAIITADSTYNYITLGNFYPDKQTKKEKSKIGTRRGAYYYIDDILIRPKQKGDIQNIGKPIKMVLPIEKTINQQEIDSVHNIDITEKTEIKLGEIYKLKNINFETGKAVLVDKSINELNKLANYLIKNPDLKVQINGHTDNIGTDSFNNTLSKNRAKSVKEYLVKKGIDENKISYKGYGSTKPIATNYTAEGREKNRRVEFKILK